MEGMCKNWLKKIKWMVVLFCFIGAVGIGVTGEKVVEAYAHCSNNPHCDGTKDGHNYAYGKARTEHPYMNCPDCGVWVCNCYHSSHHTWTAATCTQPRKCVNSDCNATDGNALGHNFLTTLSANEIIHYYPCTRCGGREIFRETYIWSMGSSLYPSNRV